MSEKKKLQEAIALFEAGRKYSKSGTIKINLNEDGYDVVLSALREKLETPRDWTPCAEGLPTNSARYKVTLQVGSEAGTWLETAIIPYRYCDGTGEWILPKSDWLIYGVIAWTKADEPWTGGLDGK